MAANCCLRTNISQVARPEGKVRLTNDVVAMLYMGSAQASGHMPGTDAALDAGGVQAVDVQLVTHFFE